jgi:hypothetical protein
MRCAICGGSTLPAAKLCGACKAALKRARHETVSQLDPLPRRGSRVRRGEKRAGSTAQTDTPRSSRPWPERYRAPAGIVALGVIVITAGYFVSRVGGAAHGPDPDVAATTAAVPYVPLPTVAPRSAPAEPPVLREPETLTVPAPAKHPPNVRPAKAAAAPPRDPVAEPAPEPVATVIEPVAMAPAAKLEPVVTDRWQLLAQEVARCGGGLGGLLCGERARWQYCDGYWGKVAQCPGAIGADFHR